MDLLTCGAEPLRHGAQTSPRIAGAFYHVIARGKRQTEIFHDEADYRAYLDRLERDRRRDGILLHAYVLMSNHVHLLVKTVGSARQADRLFINTQPDPIS